MYLWKYKYFIDVVECKSFTKAGKINYVSQTAISKQISSLEKSLGEKLLVRGTNTELQLTESGKIVYQKAKELISLQQEMLQKIKNLKTNSCLKIGVDSSINKLFWCKMQDIIKRYYKEDDLYFIKVNQIDASRMIKSNDLDIYIGYSFIHNEDYNSEIIDVPIASNPIGIYVGDNCKVLEEKEITLSSLQNYVRYATPHYPCSLQNDIPTSMYCTQYEEVHNLDTLKIKVELNNGYMFVDSYLFEYKDGKIINLPDYDNPCILKAFYTNEKSKTRRFLMLTEKIMKN